MSDRIFDRRKFFKGLFASAAVAIAEPKITYFLPPPKGWTAYKVEEGEALFYLPREYYKSSIIAEEKMGISYAELMKSGTERYKNLTYSFAVSMTKELIDLKENVK